MVYEGRRSRSGAGRGRSGGRRRSSGRSFFSVCLWVLFLALAVRLAWPEAADQIGAGVSSLLGSPDIGGAVQVFGQRLGGGDGVVTAFRDAWSYAFEADGEGEDILVSGDGAGTDVPASDGTGEALPAMETETDPVEDFKRSQKEFEALGTPNNVTFERPEIGFELASPLAGPVTSGFGYREHPSDGQVRFHYGVDIGVLRDADGQGSAGTEVLSVSEVYAVAEGTVEAVGDSTSYGRYVILSHPQGVESLYAHLAKVSVTDGERVSAGQSLGTVGSTGNATGECLHLELIVDGEYVNPEYYLKTDRAP